MKNEENSITNTIRQSYIKSKSTRSWATYTTVQRYIETSTWILLKWLIRMYTWCSLQLQVVKALHKVKLHLSCCHHQYVFKISRLKFWCCAKLFSFLINYLTSSISLPKPIILRCQIALKEDENFIQEYSLHSIVWKVKITIIYKHYLLMLPIFV